MPSRLRIAALFVTLALAAAGAGDANALILKRLDFETGNFRQWSGVNAVSGGARIVTSPVRQGHYAARFVVRPGDDPLNASGERAEAYYYTNESEGKESWWTWSTYFPSAFRPNKGAWNVFTQWHQTAHMCPPPIAFEVNNYVSPPKLRLHLYGGSLNLSTCAAGYTRTWNFATLRRGHWYRFIFHVKWSASRSIGFVQLWVNGTLRIPKTHIPTLYKGQGVSIRQGFYRGRSSLTTTIYHDGLRRYRP
ncbi:MAG TPA: polysaccharide lyase [Gaiellaceae bacterium]|jgi:Polysaccharide lyase